MQDENTKETMVIDPGGEPKKIEEMLDALKVNLKYIILTHCHGDHTGAVLQIKNKYGGKVLIHRDDEQGLRDPKISLTDYIGIGNIVIDDDARLDDEDLIHIGDMEFKIIHTPGHTAGGICIYSEKEKLIFTGDTLFRGSWGRTDLPTSSLEEIMDSITKKLMILPDETIVYPGHRKIYNDRRRKANILRIKTKIILKENKIMSKVEPRTLPGFMELLPNEQVLFNQMKEKIQKTYEKFGFLPIDTPVIESSEVLLAKAGGETEKQVYSFNKGDNNLTLRFDLTVPLAKYVAARQNELSFPFRRYQIGKVYRGERAQRGRFREFYQCDIDVIGDGSLNIINDAEIPAIMNETFKELGLENYTIHINNRKLLNGLFEYNNIKEKAQDVMRTIDKIEKIGKETVIEILKDYEIDENSIENIIKFIEIKGTTDEKIKELESLNIDNELFKQGLEELKEVVKYIRLFNVEEKCFQVDLSIARGLDYYTGTVYETILNDYKEIGSICSGGRYNDLAGYYTDKELPGVGMSIGLTRLFFILNDIGLIKSEKKSISQVLVVSMVDDLSYAINTANKLRENNINAEIYFDDKKIKAKFKYADKLKIPYVIVIGEDEIQSNSLTLKDMETGEQEQVSLEEIINKLK